MNNDENNVREQVQLTEKIVDEILQEEKLAEVLARNGLTDRDVRVTRDQVPSLAPPPAGWVNLPGPRRVLETVARLRDEAAKLLLAADLGDETLEDLLKEGPGRGKERAIRITNLRQLILQNRRDASAKLADLGVILGGILR